MLLNGCGSTFSRPDAFPWLKQQCQNTAFIVYTHHSHHRAENTNVWEELR